MSELLSIFCKSFRTDLRRVQRLLQSIKIYNIENIPIYLSVPSEDLKLFEENLNQFNVNLISDLDIISANKNIKPKKFFALAGNVSQQIIKAEFWRLGYSENYLCIDSDAVFIRPFTRNNYITEDSIPYTIIDQGHSILNECLRKSRRHVISNFFEETKKIKYLLNRNGINYSFGPFPVVWSGDVWRSLTDNFLLEKNWNILDAISQHPVESHWYGEALLKYQAIPILPRQAIFYVYHYGWQKNAHRLNGINESDLATLYDGVIYQSAWEREMDWPTEGGNMASKLARRFRRALGRA